MYINRIINIESILQNKLLIAIAVKNSSNVQERDLKGLKALLDERQLTKYLMVCLEDKPRKIDGIEILPWDLFLEKIWKNDI